MAKELVAGLSVAGGVAALAIVERDEKSSRLVHLAEISKSGDSLLWFVDIFDSVEKKLLGKTESVNVAVDSSLAFLHSFPIDTSLTQVEQNEQVQWELSNYLSPYRPSDHITDLRLFRLNAREQTAETLAISIGRTMLFRLQSALAERKLELQKVAVTQLAAESALLAIHPELKAKSCAIIGIGEELIEFEILVNARMSAFRQFPVSLGSEAVEAVTSLLREHAIPEVYLHGTGTVLDWRKALRSEGGPHIHLLNPFRKMSVAPTVTEYSRYIGKEYRFAACIGALFAEKT
ncbi:MAG TPA: hypothetical protein VKS81_05015 [Bacteroidota bacterium]|nr:hypothetical protein [Bacteroidota bacterium]